MLPPTVIAFGQTWCWICKLKNSRKTRYLPKLQMAPISKHFFDDFFLNFLSVILAQLSHIVTYSFWCFNVTLHPLICNQYICNRCLMVSTNQAYPSCFYFRISWILMKGRWFYFFRPLHLTQGLKSLKHSLLQKLRMAILDQKFRFLIKNQVFLWSNS